ncbi:MAG: hypothetical protein ACKO3G_01545, partial [Planctomycetaceae bacterium]
MPLGGAAPAAPITLDMRGPTLAARGDIVLEWGDLGGEGATVAGGFSFESSRRAVTLVGGESVDVTLLSLGVHDASGWFDFSTPSLRRGIEVDGVDLAFGLFQERSPAAGQTARQWSLLDASVGTAAVVGVDGVTLAASGVKMGYIHLPEDGSSIDTSRPIAYDNKLAFSMTADRVRPGAKSLFTFAGDFDVDVGGVVQFRDAIDIQVELDTLVVYDPATKSHTAEDVVTLTFAALDQDLFAGRRYDDRRVGLDLPDVDVAAMIAFGPQTGSLWVAVDAGTTGAAVVGVPHVSLSAQGIDLRINTPDSLGRTIDFARKPLEVPTGLAIRAGDASESIWGDGQSTLIDLDGTRGGELGVVEIADAVLDVDDFLYARGDYAFRIGRHTDGLVVTGLEPGGAASTVDGPFAVLSLAATDVDVFAGYRGPDSAGTSPFTDAGVREGAVGIFARHIDVGYALFTDIRHVFDSLKLTLPAAGLTGLAEMVTALPTDIADTTRAWLRENGIAEGITATIADVTVVRNGGVRFLGAQVAPLLAAIDFQASFPGGPDGPAGYRLTTPGGSILLDESDAVQTVGATVGNATIKVSGFLELTGSFAFTVGGRIGGAKADPGVLGLIPGVSTTGMTHDLYSIEIGGHGLRGFSGVTVPAIAGVPGFEKPVRMGYEVEDVTFGLAIMPSLSVSGITVPGLPVVLPTYIAAKATARSARAVGLENWLGALVGGGLPTFEDVSIEINTGLIPAVAGAAPGLQALAQFALPMPAIDLQGAAFAAGGPGFEIATGDPGHPVVLDFRKEVFAIDVGYFEASTFSLSDVVSGSDSSGPRAEAAG